MPRKFDPLEYSSELEAAGVPHEQAQVHARALVRVLAEVPCMRDLSRMQTELKEFVTMKIDALRSELVACMANLRAEVFAEIAELRAEISELRAEISELRSQVKSIKYELVIHRWLFGVVVAMQGATLGIVLRTLP